MGGTNSIGDDDVEAFEAVDGFLDDSLAVFESADIALDYNGVDIVLEEDFLGDLLRPVFAFVVVDGDAATFCGEFLTYQGAKPSFAVGVVDVSYGMQGYTQ